MVGVFVLARRPVMISGPPPTLRTADWNPSEYCGHLPPLRARVSPLGVCWSRSGSSCTASGRAPCSAAAPPPAATAQMRARANADPNQRIARRDMTATVGPTGRPPDGAGSPGNRAVPKAREPTRIGRFADLACLAQPQTPQVRTSLMRSLKAVLPAALAVGAVALLPAAASADSGAKHRAHASGGDVPPTLPSAVRVRIKRGQNALDKAGEYVDKDSPAKAINSLR